MKLNILLPALVASLLPMGFASCSSDDDKDDTTPYVYTEPARKADAASYTLTGTTTRSIVFGESGSVVLTQAVAPAAVKATRAADGSDDVEYIVGTYTKSGNTYTITVGTTLWGTVTVENTATGQAILTIARAADGNSTPEVAEAKVEANVSSSSLLDKLCRTWRPYRTRVYLQKLPNGTNLTSQYFEGCSFEEIKTWAETESDCNISDDFGKDYNVQSVFVTQTGTFCIEFLNKKVYVGHYTWNEETAAKGALSYEWADGEIMGCSYEDGKANVEFMSGAYTGECWLTLSSDIKSGRDTYHVQLVIRLKE